MFAFNRNNFSIKEIPITLPARTYGNSKMSTQAAINSARYIFELALKNLRRPEQFLLPSPNLHLEANLTDPQNWDAYWNESGETGNPVYEIIAGVYRRGFIKRNLEKAIRRVFLPGSSLLHAGCGSGQVDTDIQNEMKITALDISKGALGLYSRNNKNAAAIVHVSIFDLPFPDATFDGIYNLGVMEHFTENEITRILRELRRVLKPSGKIVLFWPHARSTSVLFLRLCHQFLRSAMKSDKQLHPPEISHMQSRRHAQKILASAGLELCDYSFTINDLYVQSVLTVTPSPQ
jgi:ubiquinone/menaquinone biosynthesis C-methylase UbiE